MSFVDWFMASFLYCFPYSYRSFRLLKALAKSNGNLFAIAFKSEKERQLEDDNFIRRTDNKKDASEQERSIRACTADENIIATIKMRNHFCDSNIGLFSIVPHLVIALPTLR